MWQIVWTIIEKEKEIYLINLFVDEIEWYKEWDKWNRLSLKDKAQKFTEKEFWVGGDKFLWLYKENAVAIKKAKDEAAKKNVIVKMVNPL